MKRTKPKHNDPLNNEEKHDQFIERKITIGMIVNDGFIERINKFEPLKYLVSPTAKQIVGWCLEYYEKYQKAPKQSIEDIYYRKLKEGLDKHTAEDIEDILQDLSKEYEKLNIEYEYLYEQAFNYFQEQQLKQHTEQLKRYADTGQINEFLKLQQNFQVIQPEDNKEELSITDYFTKEIKEPEWLINDFLPKGLTIFGGAPKTGKSFLLLYKVLHLAQGKYMFGNDEFKGFKGQDGQILYMALEDPDHRISERMNNIEPDPDLDTMEENIKITKEWPSFERGGLQKIEEWLKSQTNPALIVIDVVVRLADFKMGTSGGRQYHEEYRIYSPLADLAHKYNTSIILVTHTKKTKEQDVFNEILGGSGTQGVADNLMVLSRGDRSEQRVLSIRGKDIEESRWVFEVTNDGGDWIWLGDAKEVQKTDQQQSIFNFIKQHGPTTLKEVKEACNDGEIDVSANSVNTLLRKMVANERLEQPRYGRYQIPGDHQHITDIKVARRLKGTG